ncbi:MAG TPA: septal ring lytic transglycosylase RlpA family protein [Alphaproteobacteria bacterium]|nr:septal ring lytic transglycosylase RlpA family protein [Alphaproteobacteria bacterium]
MRTRREFVLYSLLGLAACAEPGPSSGPVSTSTPSPGAPTSLRADSAPEGPAGAGAAAGATFSQVGLASWYGMVKRGRRTANGEKFDPREMTGAHRSLAFNTVVRVTSLDRGTVVKVRINDRGPFVRGRVIDLSSRAAASLGIEREGTIPVKLEVFAVDQA